jgi:Ca2+-binding RTX toxin-like protein
VAHGDDNSDTIIGGGNADQLFGDGGDDTIYGGGGDDLLNGGDRSDTVLGGDGIDNITGGTGADLLYGGTDDDTISGGTGEDFLEGGLGADRLDGGSEYDTASYASATGGVRANLLNATANTGEAAGDTYVSIEHLFGSDFNDELSGTNSANRLSGGKGNDVLSGFGGADVLLGCDGNDTISGEGGDDKIDGGTGNDTLSGGLTSSDLFIFPRTLVSGQPTVGWGTDVITDFEHGRDHLDLSGSGLSLSSLTIVQQNADTLITEAETNSSILLLNQSAAELGSSDFYF